MTLISDEDMTFLRDPKNWRGGPTFDLKWWVEDVSTATEFVRALKSDREVELVDLPGVHSHGGDVRPVWCPTNLPPLGLWTTTQTYEPLVIYSVFPRQTVRVFPREDDGSTFAPFFDFDNYDSDGFAGLISACIALTRRLDRLVRLRCAAFSHDGVVVTEMPDRTIGIQRKVADRIGCDFMPDSDGWYAYIPLD